MPSDIANPTHKSSWIDSNGDKWWLYYDAAGHGAGVSCFELINPNGDHEWWLPEGQLLECANMYGSYDVARAQVIEQEFDNWSITLNQQPAINNKGITVACRYASQNDVLIMWVAFWDLQMSINSGVKPAAAPAKTYPNFNPLHNPSTNRIEHDLNSTSDVTWRVGKGGWPTPPPRVYITDKVTGSDMMGIGYNEAMVLAGNNMALIAAVKPCYSASWASVVQGADTYIENTGKGRSYLITHEEWKWAADIYSGAISYSDPYPICNGQTSTKGAPVATNTKITATAKAPLPKEFPHKCLRCGKPCYMGLVEVDHKDQSLNRTCK